MAEEILTDESPMPFGAHKGIKMINVPAGYLLFINDQSWCRGKVKKYIEDNIQVLQEEVKRGRKR